MPFERIAMLEFPSRKAAEDWYHSPEYQRILPYRLKATRCQFLVGGRLSASCTWRFSSKPTSIAAIHKGCRCRKGYGCKTRLRVNGSKDRAAKADGDIGDKGEQAHRRAARRRRCRADEGNQHIHADMIGEPPDEGEQDAPTRNACTANGSRM